MPYLGQQRHLLPSSQVSSFLGDKKSPSSPVNSGDALELITSGTSTSQPITFSNLDTYPYKHLLIIACTNTSSTNETTNRLRFNGSSTASYYQTSNVSRGTTSGWTTKAVGTTNTGLEYYLYNGASATLFPTMIWIYNYQSTDIFKQVEIFGGCASATNLSDNGTPNGTHIVYFATGAWHNTANITSVGISGETYDTHIYQLYGLRG